MQLLLVQGCSELLIC
jgi:hypothetical protein